MKPKASRILAEHGTSGKGNGRVDVGEWVSLEFSVTVPVAEWNDQAVTIMREEDTLVHDDGSVEYFSGPQTELWVIR